jgi:hypothetical protein
MVWLPSFNPRQNRIPDAYSNTAESQSRSVGAMDIDYPSDVGFAHNPAHGSNLPTVYARQVLVFSTGAQVARKLLAVSYASRDLRDQSDSFSVK